MQTVGLSCFVFSLCSRDCGPRARLIGSLPVSPRSALAPEVVFRADAAFAKPEIYEALEERGVKYAIRRPPNAGLERDIEELLRRTLRKLCPRTPSTS